MALPKELQDIGTSLHVGFTSIYIDHKKCTIAVEHCGNMGNDIKSVEKNVDLCCGKGAFKRLERLCKNMSEEGSPDYHYKRIMLF